MYIFWFRGEVPDLTNMIGDRSERYDGGSPRSNLSIDNETEEMAEEESITVGRKRASRMRIIREKMTRYSDMRKERGSNLWWVR